MPQNRQPQSPEDGPNPRRATPGEIALGMGLFIILYVIGASHLVWHEVSRNNEDTWRETVDAITGGMAETTLAGAGLAIFAIVGTKTVRVMAGHLTGRRRRAISQGNRGHPRP